MTHTVKVVWRNIWRNTRRTILTALAIGFGVALTVITRGAQSGTFAQMVDFNTSLSVGHVQIHRSGYWEKRTLRNTFEHSELNMGEIAAIQHVGTVSPKLTTEALIAVGDDNSSGATLSGIVPSREAGISIIDETIVDGAYLSDGDMSGAIIGATLARNLGAEVGDELVYFTQGRYGATAAGRLSIRGIFRAGEFDMDGFTVFAPLATLQTSLDAPGRLSALTIGVEDHRAVDAVATSLAAAYETQNLEVMDYAELIPDIMQFIDFKNASTMIFLAVLLIIIGFSILETILMSVMERFHEFGVMMAIGLRKGALVRLIFCEAAFVGAIGALIGNVLGYAANAYLQARPIALGSLSEAYAEMGFTPQITAITDIGEQMFWTAAVLLMTLAMALWPARVATGFSPVEAIRQV